MRGPDRLASAAALVTLLLGLSTPTGAEPVRPLVVVPGFLGSKLVDESGKTLWGGRDSYLNFRRLSLPRNEAEIRLRPGGIIEAIPIVWPWKVKQYDGLLETLDGLGYREGSNLFVFAYDWRRSNYTTAALLDEYIQSEAALKDKPFDIVAHSMGGVISVILLHREDSGSQVENLITLGTPFLGSLNALDASLHGFSGAGGFMSELGASEEDIRAVMLSFESGYELLPSYANCCIQGLRDAPREQKESKSIFDLPFWQAEWLPPTFSSDADKAYVREALQRGKEFSQLVRSDLPGAVNLYMYAGDKFDTKARVYFTSSGDIDGFHTRGGDETVWLDSASRGKPQDSRVSFAKHARIFDDEHLEAGLKRILTAPDELADFAAEAEDVVVISTAGEHVPVDLLSFETHPSVVRLGDAVRVRLTLAGATIQQSPEEFDFEVCTEVAAESGSPRCFRLPEVEDPSHRRFETSYLPSFSGTYTIRMQQLPAVEDYFAVVGVGVE